MWLLFLVSWWWHCDYFDCTKEDSDNYQCCVNKRSVTSYEIPGHHCSKLEWYLSEQSVVSPDIFLGKAIGAYHYCRSYKYIPPSTPQLTPQITTPARTYAKLSVKCQSKTQTDLLITLAIATFE